MPPPGRPIEDERLVYGIHPVLEALDADPPKVDRVFVGRESGSRTGRLCRLARERGVPVSHVDRDTLRRRAGAGAVHQGVAAVLAAAPYARVVDVLAAARAVGDRALLVAVEGVDDPRNLGAILRSAAAAGAAGVLLAAERTVGLTPASVKTSAGAAFRLPVARDPHLPEVLRELGSGGWVAAALVAHGGAPPEDLPSGRPTVLVAGGEARGPRAGVLATCPFRVTIPLERGSESLNVAVALGVVLFDLLRRRRGGRED